MMVTPATFAGVTFPLVGFDEAYKIGERAPHVISPRFATLQHVANLPGLLFDFLELSVHF
jgi:hypothetical protein